jgi:hypothetical protein
VNTAGKVSVCTQEAFIYFENSKYKEFVYINKSYTLNTAGLGTVCTQIAVLNFEQSRYKDCVYSNSGPIL